MEGREGSSWCKDLRSKRESGVLGQGFSASSLLTFWAGEFFVVGPVPCIAGC